MFRQSGRRCADKNTCKRNHRERVPIPKERYCSKPGSSMRFVTRHFRSYLLAAACLLAAAPAVAQQPVQSPACRERTRQLDLIGADVDALQLNVALFAAAAAGC